MIDHATTYLAQLAVKQARDFAKRPDASRTLLHGIIIYLALVAISMAGVAIYLFVRFRAAVREGVDVAKWGQLGDFVGGLLNPSFAFLTVIGLSLTLFFQLRANEQSRLAAYLDAQINLASARMNMLIHEHGALTSRVAEFRQEKHDVIPVPVFREWSSILERLRAIDQEMRQINQSLKDLQEMNEPPPAAPKA